MHSYEANFTKLYFYGSFLQLKELKGNIAGTFEDVLEERRRSSDLRYAIKNFTPVIYKDLTPCKPSVLKTAVMNSDRMQYVMKQVSPFRIIS